ncbi:hypothetical protein DEU56DRAFT_829190 [Suillus clintonianus]|uniref:uncharacterized protein n=1 Tax=Suillus clintonianus TaxID=1904413 RepID=UPI001B85C3C2|nr:uncharacterized protein DEU56DRAFT_829190 [Suillus clintonianus]KAG2123577.1 hypothetical protein DEU56DRAFT_829190 [Suillus clintonianus]
MPNVRNVVRRSRRLSHQSPIAAEDYVYEDSHFAQSGYSSVRTVGIPSVYATPPSAVETTTSHISPSLSPVLSHLLSFPNRTSHSRKKEEGHIPRPPNAFIVFRSCLWSNEDFRSLESDHRNVSRIAGERWRNLSDNEKEPFVQMAKEAKALHAKMYPNYKYSPSHRTIGGPKRKGRRNSDEERTKCDMIATLLQKGVEGSALAHAMAHVKSEDEDEIVPTPIIPPQAPIVIPRALPPVQSREHRRKKVADRPRTTRPTTTQRRTAGPDLASTSTCPFPVASPSQEAGHTPGKFIGSPELLYPVDVMEDFVPTDEIPPLNLDALCDMKVAEQETSSIFYQGMKPAAGLAYFGAELDVMPFDSYFLGADLQLPPTPPLIENNESPLSDYTCPLSTPPRSPIVFTNPWTTFLTPCSPDNEFDKYFVQPIAAVPSSLPSPYSPFKDDDISRFMPEGIDSITKDIHPEVNLDDWIHFNQF